MTRPALGHKMGHQGYKRIGQTLVVSKNVFEVMGLRAEPDLFPREYSGGFLSAPKFKPGDSADYSRADRGKLSSGISPLLIRLP